MYLGSGTREIDEGVERIDRIALEEGRIAEQGKHQELLDNKGLYAKLWNIQEKTLGWKL